MTLTNRSKTFLSAAVATLPAFFVLGWSAPVQAQYQLPADGHALDANPRIGSGGYNGGGTNHSDYNVNNNIVTGNVSGLNYFHGNRTGEFDTHTFAGQTGSTSNGFDYFNNVSAPVNYGQRTTGAPTYVTTYNQGNFVGQPQSSFISTPGGTNYIPAPRISPLTPTDYDSRLGLVNTDPTRGNLLTPGVLNVAGPVDPSSGAQSMFSMSPLYGVRQDNGTQAQDTFFNSQVSNRVLSPANRGTMTPADIQKMRDELNTTVVPDQTNGAAHTPAPGATQSPTQTPGQNPAATPTPAPVPGAIETGGSQPLTNGLNNAPLANGPINSELTNSRVGSGLNNGEGMQNQLLVAPDKQSKQLKALQEKYARDTQKLNDLQATDKFNAEVRAQKTPAQTFDGTKPGNKTTAGNIDFSKEGGTVGMTAGTARPTDKPTVATAAAPVRTASKAMETKPDVTADRRDYIVTSLATGIDAKGLAQLMKTAEEQMRQGKFTEAVDTYDTAQEVAPNNPFVSLGRGFAELGASYYGKSDQDISRAITADPAILAGRYDLKGFLGEDRLKFVHDDLEDIANHEKGARPLVLLSYVAHNGGDDATAARDLDEASKRGGYDQLIKTLREAWNLK